jgi:hypothetical protein
MRFGFGSVKKAPDAVSVLAAGIFAGVTVLCF